MSWTRILSALDILASSGMAVIGGAAVDAGGGVERSTGAGVEVGVAVGVDVGAEVGAGVEVGVAVGVDVGAGVEAGVEIGVVAVGVDVGAGVGAGVPTGLTDRPQLSVRNPNLGLLYLSGRQQLRIPWSHRGGRLGQRLRDGAKLFARFSARAPAAYQQRLARNQ